MRRTYTQVFLNRLIQIISFWYWGMENNNHSSLITKLYKNINIGRKMDFTEERGTRFKHE